jgi:hypothetical protein
MNALTRQYLFGLIFIGFGIYQVFIKKDILESSLYALAGTAFIFNALTLEPKFIAYKKPLVVITWILIGATGIFFLYILQFKFL